MREPERSEGAGLPSGDPNRSDEDSKLTHLLADRQMGRFDSGVHGRLLFYG
jgi:hypothetical protein